MTQPQTATDRRVPAHSTSQDEKGRWARSRRAPKREGDDPSRSGVPTRSVEEKWSSYWSLSITFHFHVSESKSQICSDHCPGAIISKLWPLYRPFMCQFDLLDFCDDQPSSNIQIQPHMVISQASLDATSNPWTETYIKLTCWTTAG